MSKFIILILALLAVSTLGFRMREDSPPPHHEEHPTEEEAEEFWHGFDACWESNCADEECEDGHEAAMDCCSELEWFGKPFTIDL